MEKVRYKRSVSDALKKHVAARQQWKCNICDKLLSEFYETDHVVALWRGGSNDAGNLQALCRECHARKGFNESRAARELKEREQSLVMRRAQVHQYFQEAAGSTVPRTLVHHIMVSYCGWPADKVDEWLREIGYVSSETFVKYPLLIWQYQWASAGAGAAVEKDKPVHNLQLRPNAPFALREDARARTVRNNQVSQWKEEKAAASPGRGDGIKQRDVSTLFEEFKFHG